MVAHASLSVGSFTCSDLPKMSLPTFLQATILLGRSFTSGCATSQNRPSLSLNCSVLAVHSLLSRGKKTTIIDLCLLADLQEAGLYLRNELRAHARAYKAIKALPGMLHCSLQLCTLGEQTLEPLKVRELTREPCRRFEKSCGELTSARAS